MTTDNGRRSRRSALLSISVATLATAGAACSSSTSTAPGLVVAGIYSFGPATITTDGCGVGDLFGGLNADVAGLSGSDFVFVSDSQIFLVSTSFTASGDAYVAAPEQAIFDWTTTASQVATWGAALSTSYDCVESFTSSQWVSISSTTSFSFGETDTLVVTSGSPAACIAADNSSLFFAPTSLPCQTTESAIGTQ